MKLIEDTKYKINKIRIMCNSYYLFDLYDDIYLLTRAPLFKYIINENKKEGIILKCNGELELYIAKKSRKSGDLILIDVKNRRIQQGSSYTIIESPEDIIETLL